MDSIKLTYFFVFLLFNCTLRAQSTDTTSARQIIEKGSKGDVILGKENKKAQLKDMPVSLLSTDSLRKKDTIRSPKKYPKKKM